MTKSHLEPLTYSLRDMWKGELSEGVKKKFKDHMERADGKASTLEKERSSGKKEQKS